MSPRHCTITEAAHRVGIARTTIQRWVKAGRLKKGQGGKVSLEAVEDCKAAHRVGRPCGEPPGSSSLSVNLSEQLAEPFCRGESLKLLRNTLFHCAHHWGFRGQGEQFRDAVLDSLAGVNMGVAARARHEQERQRVKKIEAEEKRRRKAGLPSLVEEGLERMKNRRSET